MSGVAATAALTLQVAVLLLGLLVLAFAVARGRDLSLTSVVGAIAVGTAAAVVVELHP